MHRHGASSLFIFSVVVTMDILLMLYVSHSQLGHGVESQHHHQVRCEHRAEPQRGSAAAVPRHHRRYCKSQEGGGEMT